MAESNTPINNRLDDSEFVVEISNQQSRLEINTDSWPDIVSRIVGDEGVRTGSVSIAIVENATIHELNRRYLDHDYPTDVLSFVFDRQGEQLEGEIILSAEAAIERAAEFNLIPQAELKLYLIHGTLHLVGYDDKDPAERDRMRLREEYFFNLVIRD